MSDPVEDATKGRMKPPRRRDNPPVSLRFVTVDLFAAMTGYTEKAVRTKIDRGDWLEGEVWERAPDGRILMDCVGYERWVQKGKSAASGKRPRAA